MSGNQLEPGKLLETKLEQLKDPYDRAAFLVYLEKRLRETADLELLRELRAYRQQQANKPLTQPKS